VNTSLLFAASYRPGMSDPTSRNRLDEEASPYLHQHADNPVNWQPWDEQALSAARERDVPIFLSVGYSACHWCHVMEEESFEDPEVARVLNDNFVPIKVDREERPDLDRIYQTVCQAVTGRGGWPLSVWLTPDGEPFYVGTYFPKEPRKGMPAFPDLLEQIHGSFEEDREGVEERAAEWTSAARDQLEDVPDAVDTDQPDAVDTDQPDAVDTDQPDAGGEAAPPAPGALSTATEAALRSADREHGGFGHGGPKFPQPTRIALLSRAHDRTGRDPPRDVVLETLDAMGDGGMYDHVGGGFHRYATDDDWTVPHFEKMLYDNAELPRVYLEGYRLTGDDRYADLARETFAFVDRELTHPDGGFYSTLDARSETPASRLDDGEVARHEEGAFYTWTPEEVRAALEEEATADLVCDRFGVTRGGNFEDGTTVLTLAEDVPSLAEQHDLAEGEVRERLEGAVETLRTTREERPRPRRDEKVLAGWNGLMVDALAEGALTLGPAYADRAADALSFVRERLWDADSGLLKRRWKEGDLKVDGYLEDYAFLARGALSLYGATGDVEHLAFALALGRAVRDRFYDEAAGTLYFTDAAGEDLVVRPQEARDQSTPSSLGVALDVLLSLDQFAPHDEFETAVERTLRGWESRITSNPMEHTTLALVADRYANGDLELTVAADGLQDAWREELGSTHLPDRLLAPRPPTADGLDDWLDRLDLDAAPPIWADRDARDGEPTVYACRSFTCSPPQTELDAALEWAEDLAPDAG
jgi:uncharacterized protein YyaL (SSP411 family)